MNHHCWRNGKTRVNEDDEIEWPKLSFPTLQVRSDRNKVQRHRISQLHSDSPSSSNNNDLQESLGDLDYPKLGETFIKRKNTIPECNQLAVVKHFQGRSERKFIQIPNSTDFIEIDFRKTLERQMRPISLLANHGAMITLDICKLNVNMSVERALARLCAKSKRKIMYIEKKKKPSKLKSLIWYDRLLKRQARAKDQKICEVIVNPMPREDISTINFEGLRINVVPQDDRELLEKMSALTCMNSNYRDTREISIVEDGVIFRPDLHEQMENMSIDVRNDLKLTDEENNDTIVCNAGFIDLDTIEATKSLKICDESGELVEKTPIKVEPCGIQFTNKFREYCTNTVTSNLKSCLDDFLVEMLRLQRKIYERDRVKGKSKRRYYAGIKEVRKHVDLKKIKFVIIATDLEKVQVEGGLDDALNELLGICKKYEVPYCFGLGRRKLGYFTYGKGFASCIGIANYSGAEEKLKNVLCAVVEARNEFSRLTRDDGKIIYVEKLLPRELLPSEMINAYLRIIASTS